MAVIPRMGVNPAEMRLQQQKIALEYAKLNDKQKVNMVEADLSILDKQIGFLTTQIEYFKECIKTLDNLAFAIRNRIRLDDEQ